jgi:hypothetical protein
MQKFATGGVVSGPIGAPQMVIAHGGETITPPGKTGGVTVDLRGAQFGPGVTADDLRNFGNTLAQKIVDEVLIPWNS